MSFTELYRAALPADVMPGMSQSKDTAMHACMLSGFSRVPLLVTVSTAEQSESVIHIHVDSPCWKSPCWTDLTTARQVEFPVLQREFSLVAYFLCVSMENMCQSQAPSSSRSLFSLGIHYLCISFGGRPSPAAIKGKEFWEAKLQLSLINIAQDHNIPKSRNLSSHKALA